MADSSDRPKRPGGPPHGKRSGSAGPAKGRPAASGRPRRDDDSSARPRRSGDTTARPKRDDAAPARPKRDDDAPAWKKRDDAAPAWKKRDDDGKRGDSGRRGDSGKRGDAGERLWTREGRPARGDTSARDREPIEDRDPLGLRSVRARHDDPLVPEEVQASELDRVARAQLKTLSKDNAEGVAKHLVMAARLIDDDPELAHQHAISAARRAGRIAVVRETLAITAYATGDFALALRELRTYRRISGRDDQLPMMVDSERGLGRAEKALELGRSVPRSTLPAEVQVELAIAMSGARLDLGQLDAALTELQIPQLDPERAFSWSPALFAAYAAVLEDLGHRTEAEQWYSRADRAAAALLAAESDEEDGETIEVVEVEFDAEDTDGSWEASTGSEPQRD